MQANEMLHDRKVATLNWDETRSRHARPFLGSTGVGRELAVLALPIISLCSTILLIFLSVNKARK